MKTPQELLQQALEAGECLLPDAPPGSHGAEYLDTTTPYPQARRRKNTV